MFNGVRKSGGRLSSKVWPIALSVAVLWISFCSPFQVRASQSVTLAWNPEPNVAGYALYYGTNGGKYTTRLDIHTNTAATVSGLKEGLNYSFAIAAYNVAGVEGTPSAPISYLVPGILAMTPATQSGNPMQIKFPVAPGHSYMLQASVDLKSWINLWQTGTSTSNAWVSFVDAQSQSFPKRFYRLALDPILGILTLARATNSGNPMVIKFSVASGHSYTLQASVDMKSWTNLWQTGTSTSNAWVSFVDAQSQSFPKRFYRLALDPIPGLLTLARATNPGDPMVIKFSVASGHSYTVQASVDMKSWTNLWQMGTATSNAWVNFQDTQSSAFPKRFYRLAMSP